MADSTNAEGPGTRRPSARWARRCARSSATRPGRVIVTSFSSHIHRLQQVIDAAAANGRSVCVIGRSMIRNLNIARNLGYATVADDSLIRPRDARRVHAARDRDHLHRQPGRARSALTRMALRRPPGGADPPDRHGGDVVRGGARQRGQGERDGQPAVPAGREGADRGQRDYVHVSGHGSAERAAHDARDGAAALLRAGARRVPDAAGPRPDRRGGRRPPHAVRIADNGTVLELDGEGLSVVRSDRGRHDPGGRAERRRRRATWCCATAASWPPTAC